MSKTKTYTFNVGVGQSSYKLILESTSRDEAQATAQGIAGENTPVEYVRSVSTSITDFLGAALPDRLKTQWDRRFSYRHERDTKLRGHYRKLKEEQL